LLIKITQHFVLKIITELQIASKNTIPVFGIASAKPFALWVWVVFWAGELREKYDARARWICPQNVSRINKGGGGQLRLGRRGACGSFLMMAIKIMPVFPYCI